ncbi:acyl-activating enzyme 14 [Fistulifera solaris]|uniref:Acyl-activating enzyme 14 n=1 Tax=Fistulifera solaris TaxID=1519565 RepID=A0A1Z5KKR9_FISSO|nr:acyl-activating enzyme 14 [Fistulifera solaris]|eukprot:GAX26914.1 acyl-activating enzyme 14 [Fistulifera solaris]
MTLQLTHVLENTCQHQPEAICATFGDESLSLTYRQACRSLAEHKVWLKQEILTGNDVAIAYLANNSIDLILSVLASSIVEFPCLLLNTRWSASDIGTAVSSPNTSAVTFLLYGTEFRERIPEIEKYMNHTLVSLPIPTFALQRMESSTSNAIQRQRKQPPIVEQRALYSKYSRKDAVIVFTSGTSKGRAKGVRLSHQAIAIQCWAKCQLPCGYSQNTKMLASTVPFFHIGGISSLLAVWMAGGHVVLPRQVGFDPESVWKFITPSMNDPTVARANTLVVVPAMLFMMQQHKTSITPNHAVQLILVGGQSITESQKSFLHAAFPVARVVQTYACTEAASSLTFHSVNYDPFPAKTNAQQLSGDCVGSPPEHVDICLVDKDLWIEKNKISIIKCPFSMGIIATRGPHVMNGYWRRGVEEQKDRNPDQYFVTNDLAYWDKNGQLFFAGRVNDSIRTGGETVLSSEVERVLQLHPLIDECAVFPVPDPKFGEAVACAIVQSHGGVTLQKIREWCQENGLSDYKHPRHIMMMKQLPKNSSGKTLKYLLIEQFSSKPRSKL